MNVERSTSSLKYPLFLGGMTAAAGLGYLYYRSMQSVNNSNFEMSREQVKAVLKEFKKEFFPILKYLTNLSLTIQNDYKKKFNFIPDEIRNNLSTILIDENPAFKEQVYAMEDRLYSKFGINNRTGFEAYVLNLAKIDSEVQALVNDVKGDFKKALNGLSANDNIDLPDTVNPDLILQVYKDSLKLVLQKILSFVMDYKERHGEINAHDENFAMQLKDLNLEQIKLKLLEEKGMGEYEDYHPERIFHFALTKYSKENQGFKDRLVKMEVFHHSLMQKLFAPNTDISGLQEELMGIDKLVEVEEFVIRELKDEEEEKVEVIAEEKQSPEADGYNLEELIEIDAVGDDVVITEQTADHITITHIHNDEIVEQIEEIIVYPEPKVDENGFILGPEEKDSEAEVENDNEATEAVNEVEIKAEPVHEHHEVEVEIKAEPVHEHHEVAETTQPEVEVEVRKESDFDIEDPELVPVQAKVPAQNDEHVVSTPKVDLDE